MYIPARSQQGSAADTLPASAGSIGAGLLGTLNRSFANFRDYPTGSGRGYAGVVYRGYAVDVSGVTPGQCRSLTPASAARGTGQDARKRGLGVHAPWLPGRRPKATGWCRAVRTWRAAPSGDIRNQAKTACPPTTRAGGGPAPVERLSSRPRCRASARHAVRPQSSQRRLASIADPSHGRATSPPHAPHRIDVKR
jgi:hypothetical protein